jgi:hypothetical protein
MAKSFRRLRKCFEGCFSLQEILCHQTRFRVSNFGRFVVEVYVVFLGCGFSGAVVSPSLPQSDQQHASDDHGGAENNPSRDALDIA